MKNSILFFLLMAVAITLHAQDCKHFNDLMTKAKTLWASGKFEQAINQLAAARENCPREGAKIDAQMVAFTQEISKKYHEGEIERNKALREAARADSMADVNRKAVLTAYADALAYKSKIALEEGDRTAAFRLAEFAYLFAEKDNPNVKQSLLNAAYYEYLTNIEHHLPRVRNLQKSSQMGIGLSFSLDGKYLAVGNCDSTVTIWDYQSGKKIFEFKCLTRCVKGIAFSKSGKYLAVGSGNEIQFWNTVAQKFEYKIQTTAKSILNIAFSPNDSLIGIVGSDSTTSIWDFSPQNKILEVHANSNYQGHIAFSPNGKHFATGSSDGIATVWDSKTGDSVAIFHPRFPYYCEVAFSGDSKYLAITKPETNAGKVVEIDTKQTLFSLEGHHSALHSIQYSPDSKQIATGSGDGTIKVWDAENGKLLFNLVGHTGPVENIAYSPDGHSLATTSWDRSVKIWEIRSHDDALTDTTKGYYQFSKEIPHQVRGISIYGFSNDSKHLVTIGKYNCGSIWNIEHQKVEFELKGHLDTATVAAYSPNGKSIATGSADSTIIIWDANNGRPLDTLKGNKGRIKSICFAANGKWLASIASDSTIRVWDFERGVQIREIKAPSGGLNCITFSPDGQLAVGSDDRLVRIWDWENSILLQTLKEHADAVTCLDFSPDNRYLVTGTRHGDGSARLWDLDRGNVVTSFRGNAHAVFSVQNVQFSPNGKQLLLAYGGGNCELWDLETNKMLLTLEGNEAHFSPDGKSVATSNLFDIVVWELEEKKIVTNWHNTGGTTDMVLRQLRKYHLENLLDLNPENESILIATKDFWQMNAFANLSLSQAEGSNVLEKVAPHYARAERLYAAALAVENEPLIRRNYANMLRQWAKVYEAAQLQDQAISLEAKADNIENEE